MVTKLECQSETHSVSEEDLGTEKVNLLNDNKPIPQTVSTNNNKMRTV